MFVAGGGASTNKLSHMGVHSFLKATDIGNSCVPIRSTLDSNLNALSNDRSKSNKNINLSAYNACKTLLFCWLSYSSKQDCITLKINAVDITFVIVSIGGIKDFLEIWVLAAAFTGQLKDFVPIGMPCVT
jgi:uncharacterized protein with PQ loop repeat